ncbi:MAG: Rieske 2Fe-2S domain-containing protein [Acidimicrobiales bacterium]
MLRSTELAAGEGLGSQIRELRVENETVLMGRLSDGRVVAFSDICPHEQTDLRQATFVDGKVRCPRHNYLYDPVGGENVIPARVARAENLWKLHPGYLPTHGVEEHDGWVWISPTPNPAPAGWDPSLEEPPPSATRRPPFTPLPTEEPPGRIATVTRPTKHLRVRMGHEFELRLPMSGPGARTWRIDVPEGVLAVVAQHLEATSPPRHRVRLTACSVGQGTVRCSFGRPWEPEPEEVRTYLVEVVQA